MNRTKIAFGIVLPLLLLFLTLSLYLLFKQHSSFLPFKIGHSPTFTPSQKVLITPVPIITLPPLTPTQLPLPTKYIKTIIPYPTIHIYSNTTITIKPGDPGSKEWEDEFNKKMLQMQQENEKFQKQVEEAQKKFCIDNPDLCNR